MSFLHAAKIPTKANTTRDVKFFLLIDQKGNESPLAWACIFIFVCVLRGILMLASLQYFTSTSVYVFLCLSLRAYAARRRSPAKSWCSDMTHYCWKVNKRRVNAVRDALATVVNLFQLVKQRCYALCVDGEGPCHPITLSLSPLFRLARCRVQSATDRISCDSALSVNGCALITNFHSIYTFKFLTFLLFFRRSTPNRLFSYAQHAVSDATIESDTKINYVN